MTTPVLALQEIAEGVASQAALHNQALREFEGRSTRVLSRATTAPPGSPSEGHSYIIPSGATGVWAGKTNQIATWIGGAWSYYVPIEGVHLWINDEDLLYAFDSTNWLQAGGAADAMIFRGVIDCSANPNYPGADRGDTYRVSVAGKIGGASGPNVEIGDLLTCLTDGTASGNHATVGAQWTITQANLDGAVIGPTSATDSHLAQFDGTSGKLIKGGLALDTDTALAANSDTRLASQKAVKAYIDAQKIFVGGISFAGTPGASEFLGGLVAPAGITTITIAAALAGSSGKSLVAATAQTDIDIRKNATTASNGTSVGTMRFAAAATVPSFIAASGFTLTGGSDYLTFWAPATPDATLATILASIYGTRS